MPWVCSIYEKRPELCKTYPLPGHYMPPSCGFSFLGDGTRRGRCLPECDASCCRVPRSKGEPEGVWTPDIMGGEPCKHLEYVDEHPLEGGKDSTIKVTGAVAEQPDKLEV